VQTLLSLLTTQPMYFAAY